MKKTTYSILTALVVVAALIVIVLMGRRGQETLYYIDGREFEGRVLREENGRIYATLDTTQVSLPAGLLSEAIPNSPVRDSGTRVHVYQDKVEIAQPKSEKTDLASLDELVSYCNRVATAKYPVIMVLCVSGGWLEERQQSVQDAWEQMAHQEHIAVISTCPDGGSGWLVR